MLETTKYNIWFKLRDVYLKLIILFKIPSDLFVNYVKIFYVFFTIQRSANLNSLFDVIVCVRRWDDYLICSERNIIFNINTVKSDAYIAK